MNRWNATQNTLLITDLPVLGAVLWNVLGRFVAQVPFDLMGANVSIADVAFPYPVILGVLAFGLVLAALLHIPRLRARRRAHLQENA